MKDLEKELKQQEIDEAVNQLTIEDYHKQQEAEERDVQENGVEIKIHTPELGDITMKV